MKKKSISPRNAKTYHQIFTQLKSDNLDLKDYWILIDTKVVTLAKQPRGGSLEGKVKITRRAFNHIVDWYNRPQSKKP